MEHKETIFQKRNEPIQSQESTDQRSLPDYYIDDTRLVQLRQLCETLNPYEELTLEEKLTLQEFGIADFSNPFTITNKLLLILEENIQFRESLKK